MYSSQFNTLLALPVSQLTNIRFRPYLLEFANESATYCVAQALLEKLKVSRMTARQRYEYDQIGHVMNCSMCSYLTAYEYLVADEWDADKALASIYLDGVLED